jgi:putative tryptophan/tyrosine transport system substrate-binding protein
LIAELAAKGHLPTIYPFRQFVEVGGLMAYGIDLSEIRHRVADLDLRLFEDEPDGRAAAKLLALEKPDASPPI